MPDDVDPLYMSHRFTRLYAGSINYYDVFACGKDCSSNDIFAAAIYFWFFLTHQDCSMLVLNGLLCMDSPFFGKDQQRVLVPDWVPDHRGYAMWFSAGYGFRDSRISGVGDFNRPFKRLSLIFRNNYNGTYTFMFPFVAGDDHVRNQIVNDAFPHNGLFAINLPMRVGGLACIEDLPEGHVKEEYNIFFCLPTKKLEMFLEGSDNEVVLALHAERKPILGYMKKYNTYIEKEVHYDPPAGKKMLKMVADMKRDIEETNIFRDKDKKASDIFSLVVLLSDSYFKLTGN